jgi:tRNA nucleotidyltransferase (CCA-adding enzyme)
MIKVFDTSAFLNRFFFNDIDNVITTNSVLYEIRNNEQKMQIENLIQKGKIQIQDPSLETIKMLKKKTPKLLSKTDLEVVALAYELKAELHTDDFLMRKFAKEMKIKVNGIAYSIEEKTSDKKNILNEVYEKIKPTNDELTNIKKVAKDVISKLNKTIIKEKMPVKKIIQAGSSARGTFITNKTDIDIFLLFDLALSVDEIKEYNKEICNKTYPKIKFTEEYGEHPYLKGVIDNHNIDFVPGFYITNIKDKKSSVDRTPLHLKFLNKHQSEAIKKQVIILKQFLKNNLLYGADQKNNGLAGYLTELLILKYGNFEKVLKAISDLENNKYIYINKPETNKKFDDYLIFIDPTDDNRNVASAVTKKNWLTFSKLAKEYLAKPSKDYFFGDVFSNEIPKNSFVFEINIKGKTPDSNWGIVKGLAKRLSNELTSIHYIVDSYSGLMHKDKGLILLHTEFKDLLNGPPISDTKNAKAFKKKHKNAFEKNGKLYCEFTFTKEQFIKETKKIINRLLPNSKPKFIAFNKLELNPEESKRIKKDFLKP